jgi:oxygen-dependent protoporphyrinogen oxidase
VDGIDIVPDGFEVQVDGDRHRVVKAKRIALAVATDAAARLLARFAPDAARELTAIDHAPVVQCAFVYPRGSIGVPLDGFGFLATRDAGVRILGAVWNSVAFPSRSDERDLLVTAFMGGAGDRALTAKPDDELAALAHADLRKAMKISETKPGVAGVFKWIPGIPQYNVGHEARVRSLEAAMARFPALALCGNFLRGVSVSDCVRQAREVALRLSGAGAGAR